MSMMNTGDILETIEMFTQDNLDVRTVTMGISLLDCIDPGFIQHRGNILDRQPRVVFQKFQKLFHRRYSFVSAAYRGDLYLSV